MKDHYPPPPDPTTSRSALVGWLLFPLALFPLVALLTYDPNAIAALCSPPAPSANWIGALGDAFAYYGYTLVGLAIWIVPVLCLLAGIFRISGRRRKPFLRKLWLALFVYAGACLIQVAEGHAPGIAALREQLNFSQAGGVLGYLTMTRCLAPLLSDFGSSVLMGVVAAVSLVAAIGLGEIRDAVVGVFRWALGGERPPEAPTDGEGEGVYISKEAAFRAAQAAKEAARAEKLAEKERIRAEKQQAKEAKQAEKEAARQAKEAEKAARRAEQERAEAELKAAEDRIAAERQAEIDAINAAKKAARAERVAPAAPVTPAATVTPVAAVAPVPAPVPAPVAPTREVAAQETAKSDKGPYILPALSLLKPLAATAADHSDVGEMSQRLIDTLKIFGVDAKLAYTVQGPVVTKYAVELAPGTRYSTVTGLSDNLMGALHAKSLRIEAPIPGEDRVGIEVPNRKPAGISFREIFESDAWKNAKAELPLLFGKRADGKELVADLASMPHMLVAGATGQGKSVCLNSLICGLLMTRRPDQMKLIMVDPKCVEFTPYSQIPHLLVPVITDNRKVVFSLHWAVAEMEKRLKLFARARVRNIYDFNHRKVLSQPDMFGGDEAASDMPKTVPYIVIIIDEAADLIGQCGKEVNPDIQRITQKARAAGIHLILATQRPDAKIITGSIKANIPGRVAFKTAQAIDSRTILDEAGAENLIGRGDMLFRGKDGLLIRAQGAWISDEDIASITDFIAEHSDTEFDDTFATKLGRVKEASIEDPFASNEDDPDNQKPADVPSSREMVKAAEDADLYTKAIGVLINTKRASISHFQRQLGIGYNHSAKLMDKLEANGVIGPQVGAGPRQILLDPDALMAILNGGAPAGNAATPVELQDSNPEPEIQENPEP